LIFILFISLITLPRLSCFPSFAIFAPILTSYLYARLPILTHSDILNLVDIADVSVANSIAVL